MKTKRKSKKSTKPNKSNKSKNKQKKDIIKNQFMKFINK